MNTILNHIANNGSKATFKFLKDIGDDFKVDDVATLKVVQKPNEFPVVVFPNGKLFSLGTLINRRFATVLI